MRYLLPMIFPILLLFGSCTTMHYRGFGLIPINISPDKEHNDHIVYKDRIEFYLWGTFPSSYTVWINEKLYESGKYLSFSGIEIEEFYTAKDWAWTIISFGVYCPKTYKLIARGLKAEEI